MYIYIYQMIKQAFTKSKISTRTAFFRLFINLCLDVAQDRKYGARSETLTRK